MSNIVETTIRPMYDTFAAELYGSKAEADAGWNRISQAMAKADAERRHAEATAAAARRAERELTTRRGLSTPVPTCARCFSQHRGEC